MFGIKGVNNMPESDLQKNILRRIIQVAGFLLVTAVILFASAGKLSWLYAWLFLAASVLILLINSFLVPPELISERGRKKEDVEKWDRILSSAITVPWLLLYLVAGLDIRFGWSPEMAVWIHIAALFAYLLSNAFVTWAVLSNNYFSTAVRIQFDRGQTVCSGGPYHYIRHPGYAGMIMYNLVTPIILGSFWALIPATLTGILFIIRTQWEDNTLKNKLPGYVDYTKQVRYKLIPGVW
jgi:protein-S-isoprenylcysteine O-methyltransferase Ste14